MYGSFERKLNNEKTEGNTEAVTELYEDIGKPEQKLRKCIMEQTDLKVLQQWFKTMACAKTIEDFEQETGCA